MCTVHCVRFDIDVIDSGVSSLVLIGMPIQLNEFLSILMAYWIIALVS